MVFILRFQLRRYAWSASLAVSILTDFEEFAVYDCRAEPSKTDKPGKGRLLYLQYDQYVERWDEIAALFSKEAVLGGSLERFIESIPEKRGIKRVDAALLEEISLWREALARNLALRNPALSQRDLNFSVQRTIDRLLFLRICEDRAIEEYGRLKALLKEEGVYARLLQLFAEADERYNSGIFHFQEERERKESPDSLTTALVIDDATLKEIIQDLYFPDSPYVFSEIPAEILGQVYEQFLGKVIRLEEGHKAIVEDKPEVRKAGGVYYTPPYIVEYIVKNTVGKLLEGNTPAKAAQLRILDPACGSGSFLIGAYQFLLDWHMEWYKANLGPLLEKNNSVASPEVLRLLPAAPEQRADRRARKIHARAAQASLPIFKANGNEWRLTTTERKRILQSNIYGVDIDPQAVEVTKLSLLLKVLEGETEESISSLLRYFKERALPDLGSNIKCGNSLIGYDYYDDHKNLSAEEVQRINAFEWKTEFPEIFERGGFDAVIGNPPYIRIQTMKEWAPLEVEHYKQKYVSASKGNYDIYVVFVERGLDLLNEHGRLGFILPHKFFNAQYGESLRFLLAESGQISEIVHFGGEQVFEGATTYTCLLFLSSTRSECFALVKVNDLRRWRFDGKATSGTVATKNLTNTEWNFSIGRSAEIFERLAKSREKLGDVAHLFVGLQTDADDVFILEEIKCDGDKVLCESKSTGKKHWLENSHLKPFLKGSLNIRRYNLANANKRLIFPYNNINNKSVIINANEYMSLYPLTWAYLEENYERLSKRNKGQMGQLWYGYVYKKNHTRFNAVKLLVPSIATGSCFAADLDGIYYFVGSGGGGGGGYGITLLEKVEISYLYLLGLLNSHLLSAYLVSISTPFRGGYIALNRQYIELLPIRTIDFSDPADVARHDRMVELVQSMLDLHKLASTGTDHDKTLLARRIEATDRQIDRLVYELYGLTEEEIGIVEEASR